MEAVAYKEEAQWCCEIQSSYPRTSRVRFAGCSMEVPKNDGLVFYNFSLQHPERSSQNNAPKGITSVLNSAILRDDELIMKRSRLEGFLSLEEGWDGAEARPIDHGAYRHMQFILKEIGSERLKQWNLFPDLNGSVMLTAHRGVNATIVACPRSVIYSVVDKRHKFYGEQLAFSVEVVKEVIEKVYSVLSDEFQH